MTKAADCTDRSQDEQAHTPIPANLNSDTFSLLFESLLSDDKVPMDHFENTLPYPMFLFLRLWKKMKC